MARPARTSPPRALEARLGKGPIKAYVGFDAVAPLASRRQPDAELSARPSPAPAAARRRRGRWRDGHDRRPIGQVRRAQPARRRTDPTRNTADYPAPSSSDFLDFSPAPNQAQMVDNRDWLADWTLIDFLRDIGKHFSSVHARQGLGPDAARGGHLVHRVLVHDPPGHRFPAPLPDSAASRCRWAAPISGATSPPARS